MMKCLLCTDDVQDDQVELKCHSCQHVLHYLCGMGYADPVRAFKTSVGKQQYKCPVCVVASSYDFIHLVLKKHEQLAKPAVPAATEEAEDTVEESEEPPPPPPPDVETNITQQQTVGERVEPVVELTTPQLQQTGNIHANLSHLSSVSRVSRMSVSPITNGQPRQRTSTVGSNGSFRTVLSHHEFRRVKRCKGMLYGLRNIPATVDSMILLDSNGRDIMADKIDNNSGKLCVREIGGLCGPATTEALKQCKPRYPKIKRVFLGLGTNDELHRQEHRRESSVYMKELDTELRKVFPKAEIHFLLPFSGIKGLGNGYVDSLAAAIRDAGVRWKIHRPPAMKGKLMKPKFVHLTQDGRQIFTKWLKRECGYESPPSASDLPSSVLPSSHPSSLPSSLPSSVPGGPPITNSQGHGSAGAIWGQASGGISRCPSHGAGQCMPGVGNRMESSEATPTHIDRLIRERLFHLVMAPQSFARPPNFGARWDGY